MKPVQLAHWIIRPALLDLGERYCTRSAIILLLATAAQETLCGRYVAQVNGPARSIYQFQRLTYEDTLKRNMGDLPPAPHRFDRLVYDLRYCTQLARLKYWLDPAPLPASDDRDGMWTYYKRDWNTAAGAARQAQFFAQWHLFVKPVLRTI